MNLLKPVYQIKGIGACRAVLVTGTAGDTFLQDFSRFSSHQFLDLRNGFIFIKVHILTSNQTIATKITLLCLPHVVASFF